MGSADAAPAAPNPVSTAGPLFIVFNPAAGAVDGARVRETIQQSCAAAGRAYELMPLDRPADLSAVAREAVRRAQDAGGVVVAAGGDGTLNAVAQVVLGSNCPFGVLPQGTFNYFGRAHGIAADTALAMQVLLDGHLRPVQVGLVGGRVFLVNASVGLYPKLLEDREAWTQQFGRSRWVAFGAGLATLLGSYRSLRLRIEVQGTTREVRTPTLFVGNNALQMEQLGFALAQSVGAGALAAIMLKPVGRRSMLGLLMKGALGRLGEADEVLSMACAGLKLDSPSAFRTGRIKVATDGEIGYLPLPLAFSISPEPLWLIKPKAPPTRQAQP